VELARILRAAGPEYLRRFGERMPPSHRRALRDLARCRTAELGGSVYDCADCGERHYAYHSCRNRHCPTCQHDRAQAWLERTRARLLPCEHYLLTFTLPAELRALARSRQTLVYDLLLREAAASLQALADDPRWVGGRLAVLAVLHTWSRSLAYHPHVHLLVTAGGLSPDGAAWVKPAHPRFLVPGYMLSQCFRGRVRRALVRAGLSSEVPPEVWKKGWNVHVQRIGSGEHAALYLSRYVYRVALTNERIERFHEGRVTFRYLDARSGRTRRITLPALDFIARFLQHVLPRGFVKVRAYGLLSPGLREDLDRARALLEGARRRDAEDREGRAGAEDAALALAEAAPAAAPRRCPACGTGRLVLVGPLPRSRAPP
jgi:hypothetical protein